MSRPASEPKRTRAAAPTKSRPDALVTAPVAPRRRTPAPADPAPTAVRAAATAARNTFHHDQAAHERARRRFDGLCAKADSTGFPAEADACRTKAEQLRAKYGL